MSEMPKDLNVEAGLKNLEEALNEILDEPLQNMDMETKISKLEESSKVMEEKLPHIRILQERLKNVKTRLKKTASDIDSAADAYAGVFLKLWEEKNRIKKSLDYQEHSFKRDFPDAAKMGKKVTEANKEKDNHMTKKATFDGAEEQYQEAKDAYENKQKEFNALKALQKTVELKLKEMSEFMTSIEAEAKEGKKEHVYFLVKDEEGGLGRLVSELDQLIIENGLTSFSSESLPGSDNETGAGSESPVKGNAREEFKKILNAKWDELNQAEGEMQDKEEAMKKAKEEYEKSQKAREELQKDRKNKILEKYKD